jgi:hypothetical protein
MLCCGSFASIRLRASCCWWGGEFWLSAELHTLGLGVHPAAHGALHNAAAFELGGNPTVASTSSEMSDGINDRLRQRPQACSGALHVAGDHWLVGRVAVEAVNGRDHHHVTVREFGNQLLELGPLGVNITEGAALAS